jgi:hypothetical protein
MPSLHTPTPTERNGDVTETTGITLSQMRQMSREVQAELDAERATKEAAAGGSRAIALELLSEELGRREAALEALALNPDEHLKRLAPAIAERQEQNARETAEREAAQQSADFAASPEGRKAAAVEAQAKADERKKLADASRQLLVDEGIETPERAADIPDDLAIEAAGIEPSAETLARREEERLLSDPAAMAAAMAEADRAAAKARLQGAAYWQMTNEHRIVEAEIAGLDPETVAEQHRLENERRFN